MLLALGIRLEINGEVPCKKSLREVAFVAVKECLTNTYAHARGNLMSFEISEGENEYKIVCMNNGAIPTKPIIEGGGLSSLRKMTESAGGRMNIDISPRFILTIVLPKEET